jgi:fermentation-respiration switch protein FrsA (DUF1100 family)
MVPSFAGMKRTGLNSGRLLGAVAALLVLAYLGANVWLIANETPLVCRARGRVDAGRPPPPYEQIEEPAGASPPQRRAWVMPASSANKRTPWIIFLHGNEATIASRMNLLHCERLRAMGLGVLAPEYRGFGGLSGVPSETGLADDALHWYDFLTDQRHIAPEQIVIYGWSLGSAVAVTLAARVDEGAVVLEGAPASIVGIGEQRYPLFPVRLLMRNPFESIRRVGAIRAPMLFLHSPEDQVVPIGEGRRLFEAATARKQFVEVAGGHVYASEKDPHFFPAVEAFLRGQRLLP